LHHIRTDPNGPAGGGEWKEKRRRRRTAPI
jgi:hypothetical protein